MPESLLPPAAIDYSPAEQAHYGGESGFETYRDLESQVIGRLYVLGDVEPAFEGPVMGFAYDKDAYDTHIEVSDSEGYVDDVPQTVSGFLAARSYDERRGRWQTEAEIEQDMAVKFLDTRTKEWWHHLDLVEGATFGANFFKTHEPTEQLVVGQGEKVVRFFNFGEAMSPARVEDCKKLVDLTTQYFGDRAYDLLSDVVIAPFDQKLIRQSKEEYGRPQPEVDPSFDPAFQPGEDGFTKGIMPRVLFVDSSLLSDANQDTSVRITDFGTGRFLEVMVHEFGHLLHGDDEQAQEDLLAFADAVGWESSRMIEDHPDWASGLNELYDYAPYGDYVVTRENGEKERMPMNTYHEEHDDKYDDDGNLVKEGKPYYRLGSPTGYGEKSPQELSAETTAYSLLGDFVMNQMPETHDAWLAHIQKRVLKPGENPEDRPVATLISREPISVAKMEGADIIYPRTELPDRIYVRALPRR